MQPTDTQCMGCGADLLAAGRHWDQQLREQSLAARTASGQQQAGGDAAAPQYVTPGETSDDTRLRIFDRQEAKRLAHERASTLVIAVLAGVVSLVLLILGAVRLLSVGFSEVGTLRFATLRNWAVLTDPRFVAIILTGPGVAGTMCAAGMIRRAIMAGRAIQEVKRAEKPTIVSLSWLTHYGLLLLAVFCPPLGLILGVLLKFSSDQDIKNTAGTMIIVSLVVIAILVVNGLLGLAEGLKTAPPIEPVIPE